MTTPTQPGQFQPPVPLHWQELIAAARHSLTPVPPATTATRAAVHRAISTAYYAVFHALKESVAAAILNRPADQFTAALWTRIYRAGTHRGIRDSLYHNRRQMSGNSARLAADYRNLYNARIQADYDPSATYTARDAENFITRAETAIQTFLQLPQDEKGAIIALTILGNR